jgi:hypothetical protein
MVNARPAVRTIGARSKNQTERNENMHVVIRHSISDAAKWDRSVKNIMSMIE